MTAKAKKPLHTDYFNNIQTIVCQELQPFIRDHFDTWDLLYRLREDEGGEVLYHSALKHIEQEINHHFILEERLILAKLANHIAEDKVGPIGKLIFEHDSIRERYHNLKKNIDEAGLNHEAKGELKFLAYLIMKHIEKEDHYFYPMVSLILSKQEKQEIQKELEKNIT